MGTLKRIGNASQGEAQGKTTGGRLRRIDTGEIITYNPDPVRSLPQVSKITGGGQTASPSLPTLSDWSGGRRGEGNAAIAKVTELRDLRDEARQEFLNYRAASTAGITLGTPAAGEYTGRKYKSEQEAYDAWQKYKKETEDLEKENGLEEYSVGKSAAGALQKGLGQIAQFSGDTLALAEDIVLAPLELFGGDELGTISDTAPFNTWAKNIREEQEAVQEYYAPNAEKGGKAAQLFEDLGTGVVAAVPQAVLALLTGGTSAAAQSTAGLTRTATQAVSPGVATTIQNAVSTMAKDPQYWTSFAQVVGGSYEQALSDMIELEAQKETTAALTGTEYEPPENQNAMRVKAALYAIGNGLMNAAVEVGGGIQTLPDELKHGGSAWRAWVDSMVDEGTEEVVQGVIERALQNPMYGMDNPLFSTTDERAILNPITAGEEFLGGAVVGGVLGGGQIGVTRGINAAARRAAEAQGRVQPRDATQRQTQEREDRAAEANLAELEQSAAAAGVTEADVKTAAEISRATGREIRFYDGNTRRDPSGRANGYFDGNTIYVNSRSANPVAQIISHELTHSVEMADAYRDLSALVFDRIQRDGGNLEKLRQEKRDLYDRMGAGLHSQEMVDQEIVAEYVEHNLLTNEQEILDLTRENPTLGQRIMDWIDRLLARLGNADAQERAFLTNARDTYARALEQTGTERAAGGQAMQAVTQTTETTTRPAGEEPAQATPRQQPAAEHPRQEQPAAPAQEEQRQRTREEIRQEVRSLREDYNAGRISDEEFDEALDAIMEEEGLEDVSMLGRYSFGGRNANRADLEALDRAQDMERRGVAADTIFRETGWFQGADGKWRFEIDDSGMEYSRWGDMNRSDRTEYARFRELEGKFIDGTITQEEQAELRSLLEEGHGPGRAEEQQTLRLSDFVRHDDLYQNYPQLRQASLRFADLPEGTYGTYNAETNTITLNNSLRDAPEDTLVHEIQHAIQNAEGFAAGASPDYWESARIDAETAASAARENLRLWLQDIGYLDYVRQSMDRVVAGEITLDQHWENLQRFKENSNRAREIAVSEEEVARYEERLREIDQMGMTARELYQNTAGEIEARDVTARRQLTPEQRRQTMPDTGDENTVFAERAGDNYSVEEPTDAQQEEADRLLFQGVDADTIREMTGLERTADGGWRFAVDTAQAAAYDGGRRTDQQGGMNSEYDTQGALGETARREVERAYPGRIRDGQTGNETDRTGDGRTQGPAEWARGHLIDRPSQAAGIAVENAGRYGADAFVVEDSAIKERSPGAWALTSGGRIYISDSVPADLADVVGYHEAIHAAKQTGNQQYRDFVDDVGGYIDFQSDRAAYVLGLVTEDRFPGKDLMDLSAAERETAYDELNALVWGYHKADPENARAQFADMFRDYDAYIADLDAAMESGAEPEVPGLSLPTLDDEDTRYSMDEDAAAEPSDNPLPTVEQEQEPEQSYFDTLPRRVQNYLTRAENYLVAKVGNQLNVPRTAQRDYLKGIARKLTEEYMQQGHVSQETMDRMFDEAYDRGVIVDRDYYDEYKDLRDYLRKADLQISREDAADIQDFNDFRKSNFGRLKISTKSGRTNIDQVYMELQERWPEFFNEQRESTPGDQLVRMAEIAQSFQIAEKSLNDYYGEQAADYRAWAKRDFEAAVTEELSKLRNAKRFLEGRPAEEPGQAPTTLEEVSALWKDLKDARRTYERAAARNLLTDHDEVQVGRLLRGETELQYLNPETENVQGITEVYQAKQEYERISRLLRQWNQSRKAALRQQAEQLLETANDWKDKKSGILYARETMERNIRDIVSDERLADQIIDTYFTPVHRAAADANRLKNRFRDQVRNMDLSRSVADGNIVSEAHAVQLLGEAEDNIRMIEQSRGRRKVRDGKTLEEWRAVVNDLWKENPNLNEQKIRDAVKQFRTIYDELFQMMNDTRVRNGYEPVNYRQGYFPHFQPGDGDGIMAQFGRALGIGTEVTALPTTINGMTHAFRPGIRWFGNAQERLGFNTAYDAVEGFDRYIEGVADVIYQTDNIQRLRALATEIRYRTGDEGIRKQIDRIRDDPTLDDEDKRNRIEKIVEDGRFTLSNFVVDLDEYTNLLANKKSRADRDMEQRLGRGTYNVVRALESRVAANMVAINPASWLTNFIPLTQGGALLDRGYLMRGMWETLQAYKESDGIVERSAFLTNRRGSDPILSTYEQGAEPENRTARRIRNAGIAAGKVGDALSSPMEWIDNFTADSLVRARYRQNLARGMSEDAALADADAFAASVMADRSKGATPTMFSRTNPVSKLFTQFQLEVNNQLSYVFKDMPREKKNMGVRALAAALLKFALGAWLYDEVYEYFIGRRPALDPIGILNDTVGDLTGWELPNLVELGVGAATGDMPDFQVEQPGLYETVANLGTAAAEELPFIGGLLGGGRLPIGSAHAGHRHPGTGGHRRRVGSVQSGSRRPGTRCRSPSPIW